MLAVVRADCCVTALMQMALIAVTPNFVEEDGSSARSALNVNAIAETRTSNYLLYALQAAKLLGRKLKHQMIKFSFLLGPVYFQLASDVYIDSMYIRFQASMQHNQF